MTQARMYLRASDKRQDAERARAALKGFAKERGLSIAGSYVEHESGTRLARPELFRLIEDSEPGDVLLIEQVDRLSRLTESDWKKLRAEIEARQIRIVALDLPTSWTLADGGGDEFTGRMFGAINSLMLDLLAAMARKDWGDRRRRQAEGIAKHKASGGYKGRPEDTERNSAVEKLLGQDLTWAQVMAITRCSRATIAKVAARMRAS